jgi:hypothetical protein
MISRRILAAFALLCVFIAPIHAQKTKSAIITEIPQLCPPNQLSGLCTVPNANQIWSDIVNSIMPNAPVVSGNQACFNGTTGLLEDCGVAPFAPQLANQVFAGPASGSAAIPAFRALVGTDLPNPGASSLGGVQSKTCSTSNWFNSLSTGGVFGCTQPAFSDLTGSITSAQCISATTLAQGCVIPDGVTITIVGGKIVASGGTATVVDAAGGTGVTNCTTSGGALYNNASNKVNCVGGQWQCFAPLVASNSANLQDTTHITSTFNHYEIRLTNLLPATNNVTLEFQIFTGVTLQTSGYTGANITTGSGTTAIANPTTFVQIGEAASVVNTSALGGVTGWLRFDAPSNTSFNKAISGRASHSNGTIYVDNSFSGAYGGSQAALTGINIQFNTGNITSGSAEICGSL